MKSDIYAVAERFMTMSPGVWARHANPLSVYSRILGGTFLFFALWSAFWIDWISLVPILLAMGWVWLNPRAFAPPRHSRSWATRAVLGERAFLNRKTILIPAEHKKMAYITTGLSVIFLSLALLGAVRQDFWLAFAGWHGATLAKVWFCDRMAWLWEDMKLASDIYQRWNQANWSDDV